MAGRYGGKRRFRPRRRAPKKKQYRVSTRKLADKRVNTLIERRIVSLAKKEIAKDRLNLTQNQLVPEPSKSLKIDGFRAFL